MLNWQNQGHHLVKYSNQTSQYAKKVLFSTATNCGTKLNRIVTLLSWSSVKCTNSTESPFCKSAVSKLNLKISAKHWKEKATDFFFCSVTVGFDWDRQIGRLLWWKCKGLEATGHRNVCHVWRNTSWLENPRKCWWKYWSIESILRNLLDWVAAFTRF